MEVNTEMMLTEIIDAPGMQVVHAQIGYGFGANAEHADKYGFTPYAENTQLIMDVWTSAKQSIQRKSSVCVYLQATMLEAQVTYNSFDSARTLAGIVLNDGTLQDHEKLHIMTFSHFCQLAANVERRGMLPIDMVLMIDSEISPSVSGEIARALIAQMMWEKQDMDTYMDNEIATLFMSLGGNDHHLSVIENLLEVPVQVLSRSPPQLAPNFTVIDPSDIPQFAQAAKLALDSNKTVLSFLNDEMEEHVLDAIKALGVSTGTPYYVGKSSTIHALQLLWEKGRAFISVSPLVFNRVLPFRGRVGLVLSDVTIPRVETFDDKKGLLMARDRNCGKEALLLQHSYGCHAGIMCTYSPDGFEEKYGQPINRMDGHDIMAFVFRLIYHWAGIMFSAMPLGDDNGQDPRLYPEIARRLSHMGLVQRFEDGCRITDKGSVMYFLLEQYPDGDFNALCFLAGGGLPGLSPMGKRILIRLGSIAFYQTQLYKEEPGAAPLDVQALFKECRGPVAHLASQGFLWTLFGIWENLRIDPDCPDFEFDTTPELRNILTKIGPISRIVELHTVTCQSALAMVRKMEANFGLAPGSGESEPPLTDQDIDSIQFQLAQAWFDKAIAIPLKRGIPAFSLIARCSIILDILFENVDTRRNQPEHSPSSDWMLGFAFHFSERDDGLFASRLMLLPPTSLTRLLNEAGLANPSVLFRSVLR